MGLPLFTIGATAGVAGSGFTITLGHVLGAVSALTGSMGAVRTGQAQQSAAHYQAQHLENQAKREREIGTLNAKRVAEENKRLAGTQRALLAGGGRSLASGSALLVQEDLDEEGKFNEMLAADAGEAKFQNLRQQAVLERMTGKHARTAGYYRAGSTLLKMGTEFS